MSKIIKNKKVLIVGAGPVGCTIAEILSNKKFNIEIIDILSKYYNNVDNLYIEIPIEFIDIIKEYNNVFVQNQINYINEILKFDCRNISGRIKLQVKYSKEWCEKYDIPINNGFYLF